MLELLRPYSVRQGPIREWAGRRCDQSFCALQVYDRPGQAGRTDLWTCTIEGVTGVVAQMFVTPRDDLRVGLRGPSQRMELLIDLEEDKAARAVVLGLLREMDRK